MSDGRADLEEDQLTLDLGLEVRPAPKRRAPGAPAPRREAPSARDASSEDQPALDVLAPEVTPDPAPAEETGREYWSAIRIARTLGRPDPTPEQVAVIEAPVEPLLVVAGAGSGKTETMASRVVWLVANGHVRPDQVLGLTFTRKAAGELGERIRGRLRALSRRRAPGTAVGPVLYDPTGIEPVAVSTYHAYAATLLGDHGLRLGVEPGATVLGQGAAWQLVDEIVRAYEGDMADVPFTAATVTNAVLDLAGECAEHLLTPAEVESVLAGTIERVLSLPATVGEAVAGAPRPAVRDRLVHLAARRQFLPLVEAYRRRKAELRVLDFGDQVALAARLAQEVPAVGEIERERYCVVLLDEYQDTSHAQLVLLRALFGGGHPVTAVGDPHQSIYGWRGASAGNLTRFPEHFPRADGAPAPVTQLSTSWRNDEAVLAAANRLAAPLQTPPPWTKPGADVRVARLAGRPDAGAGRVEAQLLATVEDEARAVAEVIDAEWRAGPVTAAVLCRKRSQFPLIEAALRTRGIPVEVVGLGGLLHLPEIVDLRAALEVVHDPTRGDSLMRLLTGSAWQIGAQDLEALGRWAQELVRRVTGGRQDPTGDDAVDLASIVEAVDDLPESGWRGPQDQELSASGRDRLERLGETLRTLRTRIGLSLPELVTETERALLLDVEVASRPGADPALARAHLDAFTEVAAAFEADAGRGGLGAFLAWLSAAESAERGLEPGSVEVTNQAVQLLTVHAAKGLEWDVVAVPGLVEGTFPTSGSKRAATAGQPGADLSKGWLGDHGAVPYELRGDAADLPEWRIGGVGSQDGLLDSLTTFFEHCGARELAEERRLAYVAVTRARRRLLLTGAVWGDATRPRTPSRFLEELASDPPPGLAVAEWPAAPEAGSANPREAMEQTASWPEPRPLGERHDSVTEGARMVRDAMLAIEAGDGGGAFGLAVEAAAEEREWAHEVDLLLAERDRARSGRLEVELPPHLSASRVVALATDAQEVAESIRRPMPHEPSPAARQGSRFHAWLEQRYGSAALVDVDDLPGAGDDLGPAEPEGDLKALQEAFLASEWAERTAEAVEVSVETPVDGLVLRGRIDAVFRTPSGGWDVVDWKTGRPPAGVAARARAVQLAVYRLAWSRLTGVPLDQVSAAFFYAATGETVRPVDVLDEAGLVALLRAAAPA